MSGFVAGSGANVRNITTAASTLIKTGKGLFQGLSVNTPQAGASVTVYDGIDNTGTKIGTFSAAAQNALPLPVVALSVGLFVVTAGGTPADVTVYYQ